MPETRRSLRGAKKRADKSAYPQVFGTGEPSAAARVSLLLTQRIWSIGQRVGSKRPCSPDQAYRVPCCGTQGRADEIPLPVWSSASPGGAPTITDNRDQGDGSAVRPGERHPTAHHEAVETVSRLEAWRRL